MPNPYLLAGLALGLGLAVAGHAQTSPVNAQGQNSPVPPAGETITLPSFEVKSAKDVSYIGKQAMSSTRTGVELINLPQSVKVLNRAFIDDINPAILVDLLKYVGGGQAGNVSFADDRASIRGFSSPANIGDFVDGFRSTVDANTDLVMVDRVEIIKGPSAIFVANGPVGGVINKITKGPVDYDIRSLRVQGGSYDANRVELDLGGRITADGKFQYRLVLGGQYDKGYYDDTESNRLIIAPSLAYVFRDNSKLTFKSSYFYYDWSSFNGLPIDLRTGKVIAVPRASNISEDQPQNFRKDKVFRAQLEYTKRFNDIVAMRIGAFHSWNNASRVESTTGPIPANFINGQLRPRSTTAIDDVHDRNQLQTDFVFTFNTGPIGHRLLVGQEWADAPDIRKNRAGTSSAIDPFNNDIPGTVTVGSTDISNIRTNNKSLKGFYLETVSFFKDRLQLSWGQSRIRARTSSTDRLVASRSLPETTVYETLKQYGALFKVTPHISVYYGYNENFATNFNNGAALPSQSGEQDEIGLKADILNGRLNFNLAYFDLSQTNIPVDAFPATVPRSFILVPGQTSEGIDGDITFSATKNLDFVGSFAFFDSKRFSQANSAAPVIVKPVNSVAESTFGLFTRYKFLDGDLKGLSVGVGISHLSNRPVTPNNNAVILGQLGTATPVDLTLTYDRGKFRYALFVNNLLDEKYIQAARNDSIIINALPINFKASVTWKF